MTLGGSIGLLVIGAILYFATEWSMAGIDMDVVGVILMIAGAVGLILSMFYWGPTRASTTTTVVDPHAHDHGGHVH